MSEFERAPQSPDDGSQEGRQENFNLRHPELQEGEMFLTNEAPRANEKYFEAKHAQAAVKLKVEDPRERGKYKTARVGNVAYDVKGEVVEGLFPVFVQRSEYEEKNR